jgi:hypothetical protein
MSCFQGDELVFQKVAVLVGTGIWHPVWNMVRDCVLCTVPDQIAAYVKLSSVVCQLSSRSSLATRGRRSINMLSPNRGIWGTMRTCVPYNVQEKLSLKKIRLGSTPPTLSNMRVYSQPSSNDNIVLECNMAFFTDADFNATAEAKVRTLKVTAQAFITSLRMEGKVRLQGSKSLILLIHQSIAVFAVLVR